MRLPTWIQDAIKLQEERHGHFDRLKSRTMTNYAEKQSFADEQKCIQCHKIKTLTDNYENEIKKIIIEVFSHGFEDDRFSPKSQTNWKRGTESESIYIGSLRR